MAKRITEMDDQELKRFYDKQQKEASKSINKIIGFRLNQDYANTFDTEMLRFKSVKDAANIISEFANNNNALSVDQKLLNETGEENIIYNDAWQQLNKSIQEQAFIANVANKRTVDLIRRTATITKYMHEIIMSYAYNRNEWNDESEQRAIKLVNKMASLYQFAQLDLTVMKVLIEKIPLHEAEFIISKQEIELNETIGRWNEFINKTGIDIPAFDETKLNISDDFYKDALPLFKSRKGIIKNIDNFLGEYLEQAERTSVLTVKGGAAIE